MEPFGRVDSVHEAAKLPRLEIMHGKCGSTNAVVQRLVLMIGRHGLWVCMEDDEGTYGTECFPCSRQCGESQYKQQHPQTLRSILYVSKSREKGGVGIWSSSEALPREKVARQATR
jgi:hypothetical protein